jgi:hypothetical protein
MIRRKKAPALPINLAAETAASTSKKRTASNPYRSRETKIGQSLPPQRSDATKGALMSYIKQMFETHPINPSSDHAINIECITACYSCAEACNACADACLAEQDVAQLIDCIRDCTDCADVCLTTGRIISRFTRTDFKLAGAQLRACIQACQSCGALCEKHGAKMAHCRVCAEACRRCAKACEALLAQ